MPVLLAGRGTGEDFRRHQQQRGVPSSDEHFTPSETAPSEASQHRPGWREATPASQSLTDLEESYAENSRPGSQETRANDAEEEERMQNMLLELEIMEESEQEEFLRFHPESFGPVHHVMLMHHVFCLVMFCKIRAR